MSLLLWFRLAAESYLSNSKQQKVMMKLLIQNLRNWCDKHDKAELVFSSSTNSGISQTQKRKIMNISVEHPKQQWQMESLLLLRFCFWEKGPINLLVFFLLEISTVSYTMFRFVKSAIKSQTFDINASHKFL